MNGWLLGLIRWPVQEGSALKVPMMTFNNHTKWGSLAGLTVKRDDVTGLVPMGDLGLIDKSSFLFDSLLLMFGPEGEREKIKHNVTAQSRLLG